MDRLRDAKATLPDRLVFGRFELQPFERRLLVDGVEATLGGRAFDVLLILAERMGSLVSRNELIDRVWSGLVVEENNLNVQVHALRRVLGGDVVVTVPGRGYRLVGQPAKGPAATRAVPPTLPSHVPTHVPTPGTPLRGREAELDSLASLAQQHRLVTVIGAGGIGKTRLAQALMQSQSESQRWRGGVVWIDLGQVREAAALPGVVASAMELRYLGGDSMAALVRAAAGLELLVALDNAEHLLDGVAALVAALLEQAPGLSFIVTSQAPLRLASEQVLHLGPLAITPDHAPADQARRCGAVALFIERARAADSRFALADAQLPAVIALCRSLDGLPLAIELAAARAPALGLDTLREALSGRLHLLTATRNREAPPRQQTLRAALAWSVGLLGAREQRLFRALAVLAGSASLALVQRLAHDAPNGLDEWGVLDALDQLVQRSLVEVGGDELGAAPLQPRYRLLESPRALALEELAASGEEQALRRRHAQAVLAEFERAEEAMVAGARGVDAWRRDGEHEIADARQAIAWAESAGDNALAIALIGALLRRIAHIHHMEGLPLAARCETLLASTPDIDPVLARKAWSAIAIAVGMARLQKGLEAAMRALTLARRLHGPAADPFVLAESLCTVASLEAHAGRVDEAQALLREASAVEEPGWPPLRLLPAVHASAWIAAARGDTVLALKLRRRLVELGLAAGEVNHAAMANVADAELQGGDAEAAVKTGRALVVALAGLRSYALLAQARLNLAAAHMALSQVEAARETLRAAWPTARQLAKDTPGFYAAFVDHASLLAALEDRHADAAQLMGIADRHYAQYAEPREPNETAASERAGALAHEALGVAAFEALRQQGRTLPDLGIAELAFGAAARSPRPPEGC